MANSYDRSSSKPLLATQPPDSRKRMLRIQAGPLPASTSAICEPVVRTTDAVTTSMRTAHRQFPAHLEQELIVILTRPSIAGRPIHASVMEREREVTTVLLQLEVADAIELARRLDADRLDDALSRAFRRVVVESRVRLRGVLANARRRATQR